MSRKPSTTQSRKTVPWALMSDKIGVYVKSMDRYGIWGLFVSDDFVSYTSFYSADEKFKNEKLLDDTLKMRMCIDCRDYSYLETNRLEFGNQVLNK